MVNPASLLFVLIFFFASSNAISIITPQAQESKSFKIQNTQTQSQSGRSSCSYTVTIKTSCSSVRFTQDRISISFGDAYGNQVYAPRIDDPYSRTFERCSTDTFQIRGPCTYKICYLYLLRSGYDGWKPETVNVYGPSSKVSFYYNTFVPNGVWYGFNLCNSNVVDDISGSTSTSSVAISK
ncbi:embryo-specific protein ATS3A-like [Macadamia integrifolia]|uniref:embryo-specific protein ATS3A-like n=1 Tax=Macadamia integrifolia TaxID=60698 RepID=UPI001C4F5C96|nr:embryo-specific protein ATS3A-like [Macadamia integrifolia]